MKSLAQRFAVIGEKAINWGEFSALTHLQFDWGCEHSIRPTRSKISASTTCIDSQRYAYKNIDLFFKLILR